MFNDYLDKVQQELERWNGETIFYYVLTNLQTRLFHMRYCMVWSCKIVKWDALIKDKGCKYLDYSRKSFFRKCQSFLETSDLIVLLKKLWGVLV